VRSALGHGLERTLRFAIGMAFLEEGGENWASARREPGSLHSTWRFG